MHRPLAPAGHLIGRNRVEEIIDKGPGRGALIYVRRDLEDALTGEPVCTIRLTSFARADGGFGGPAGPLKSVHRLPERAPDQVCDRTTWLHTALLYRLNGDYNPLHADPEVARAGGFPRPILHGLCTYGVACRALVRSVCGNDASRVRRIDVRFSAPAFPGDTLSTEIWDEGPGRAGFRVRARGPQGEALAIDNGLLLYEVAA
jgi:acyl dehydratase